jgi:hypothetical protein
MGSVPDGFGQNVKTSLRFRRRSLGRSRTCSKRQRCPNREERMALTREVLLAREGLGTEWRKPPMAPRLPWREACV